MLEGLHFFASTRNIHIGSKFLDMISKPTKLGAGNKRLLNLNPSILALELESRGKLGNQTHKNCTLFDGQLYLMGALDSKGKAGGPQGRDINFRAEDSWIQNPGFTHHMTLTRAICALTLFPQLQDKNDVTYLIEFNGWISQCLASAQPHA